MSKYPEAKYVDICSLIKFDHYPTLIITIVSGEIAERVAKKLSGSAEPSGIDSIPISRWMLKSWGEIASLRKIIAKLVEWLAYGYPPWVAYLAMMWYILIGLEKWPGVWLICIGDILRRLAYKVILIVVGNEATRACNTDQLCDGLEAGIEGRGVIMFKLCWRRMNLMKKRGESC